MTPFNIRPDQINNELLQFNRKLAHGIKNLYDMEEIGETGRFPAFLETLEQGVQSVFDAMRKGEYAFGREDLPFMEVVEMHAEQIPFAILLRQINETHRRGLDVVEEE